MKTSRARVLVWLTMVAGVGFLTPSSPAQNASSASPPYGNKTQSLKPTPSSIVQRDANSRVWERYTFEKSPDGTLLAKPHRIVELATGMHYQRGNQWVESQELIDVLPQGGAEAVQGQHSTRFPGDIYTGQIILVTPDNKRLSSRPIGISYDDGQNTVLIAQLLSSA
jgi:hypothetical protein